MIARASLRASALVTRAVGLVALVALIAVATGPARPQEAPVSRYPNKPIRIVVGFNAGGGNDLLSRIVGQMLAQYIGQPVVVENKPGAEGRLAVEYAQRQSPDGYTLIVGAIGQLAIASAIYPNLPFHPTKTLTPLTLIGSNPLILVGPVGDPIKSVQDLIAWGKANPDRSNYPTSSPAFTIPTELFKLRTGMPGQPIPYKSTNEMVLSIVAGQTLFAIADPLSVLPQVQSGKVRALCVASPARLVDLPDTPTMAEVGLGDVDIRPQWSGAFVTSGTPAAVVIKLETELRRALADAEVRDRIRAIAYDPGGGPGEDFARQIEADIRAYSDTIKAANLKFD